MKIVLKGLLFALLISFGMFLEVLKHRWYVVGIPVAAMVVHGAYTGSWYIWSSIIAALCVAVFMTASALQRYQY
jgi:hypothetical protein